LNSIEGFDPGSE